MCSIVAGADNKVDQQQGAALWLSPRLQTAVWSCAGHMWRLLYPGNYLSSKSTWVTTVSTQGGTASCSPKEPKESSEETCAHGWVDNEVSSTSWSYSLISTVGDIDLVGKIHPVLTGLPLQSVCRPMGHVIAS